MSNELITAQNILNQAVTEVDDTATVTLKGESISVEQAHKGINPAFDLIGLTDLRNDPNFANIDGTGFDVAVIDTGLDATHPLLDDNYRFGIDYIDGDNNPNDLDNHGTHVAGIIGAEDENIGVAPDVGLIGLKVGENREINKQAINDALQQVLDEVTNPDTETNIVAVNLSLGGGFYTEPNQPNSSFDQENRRLIQDLESAGVVVVAAAGNNYEGRADSNSDILNEYGSLIEPNQLSNLSSPAIYSTIAVGAVWQDNVAPDNIRNLEVPGKDRIVALSQRLDSDNFLFAPGAIITSTVPETDNGSLLGKLGGTSQASPHVAGSVALLQEIATEYDVRLSPEQVKDYLISNADIITDGDDEIDAVDNTNLDYPRINIYQSAIALQKDLQNDNLLDSAPLELANAANDNLAGVGFTSSNFDPLTFTESGEGGDSEDNSEDADSELFHFAVPDNGTLEIDLDLPDGTFSDSFVKLFNQDRELFFTSNEQQAANDDENSATKDNLLTVKLEADTEYYLEINNYNSAEVEDSVTGKVTVSGSFGNYNLTIDDISLSDGLDSSLPIYPITQSELGLSPETASTETFPFTFNPYPS